MYKIYKYLNITPLQKQTVEKYIYINHAELQRLINWQDCQKQNQQHQQVTITFRNQLTRNTKKTKTVIKCSSDETRGGKRSAIGNWNKYQLTSRVGDWSGFKATVLKYVYELLWQSMLTLHDQKKWAIRNTLATDISVERLFLYLIQDKKLLQMHSPR